MAKGMPSMVALLGLLAVTGFQNRDKLGELLGGLGNGQTGAGDRGSLVIGLTGVRLPQDCTRRGAACGLECMLGNLGGMLGGAAGAGGLGSVLSGGLGDLVDRFNNSGQGAKAQSWVQDGVNEEIDPNSLEQTLGADTIDTLTRQTGLSKQELLDRLAKTLPDAVNKLTPNGRIPTEQEASHLV